MKLTAPPSKSLSHRAFLLGAIAREACTVKGALLSADTRATLVGLGAWGAEFEVRPGERGRGDVLLRPFTARAPLGAIDCGNSGTTLRLLAAQAARFDFGTTLTGDESLRTRPNEELLAAMESLGARVSSAAGRAPLQIQGPLAAGDVTLPPRVSSQYASALLLSLSQVEGNSAVTLQLPIASRPYLDLTIDAAASFGIQLPHEPTSDPDGLRFRIAGAQRPRAAEFVVEGDWSSAAFPLVAAAITGGEVEVTGLRRDSRQGDRAILRYFEAFGAGVAWRGDTVSVQGAALRSPREIDVAASPDLFPPLCALAACSAGTTTLHGSRALRHKESDRIRAMATGLAAMGIQVEERIDGLVVTGGTPRGAPITTHADHRIHMAFAILSLVTPGEMTLDHPECVDVSYPGFHEDLAALRAGS